MERGFVTRIRIFAWVTEALQTRTTYLQLPKPIQCLFALEDSAFELLSLNRL